MRIVTSIAAIQFFSGVIIFNRFPTRVTYKRRRAYTIPS